jgi:hypothetical protein
MQTFIPQEASFAKMAEPLDRQRLNKQALEGWQILLTLLELDPQGNHRDPKGWKTHPAVTMWRGHETALYQYVQQMVVEWKARGYNSTIGDKAQATILRAHQLGKIDSTVITYPWWIQDTSAFARIASSHRVALLRKNYEWYSQFNWPEDAGTQPDYYQYLWPSENGDLVLGTFNNA